MALIIIVAIIVHIVLIIWTWNSLGSIEKNKKIFLIIIEMIITYIITFIIFQISKNGIIYQNFEMQKDIRNVLVTIFAGINGIIFMPQIGKILDKKNEDEIDQKKIVKKIGILIILLIICFNIEIGYMKETQEVILEVYKSEKNK